MTFHPRWNQLSRPRSVGPLIAAMLTVLLGCSASTTTVPAEGAAIPVDPTSEPAAATATAVPEATPTEPPVPTPTPVPTAPPTPVPPGPALEARLRSLFAAEEVSWSYIDATTGSPLLEGAIDLSRSWAVIDDVTMTRELLDADTTAFRRGDGPWIPVWDHIATTGGELDLLALYNTAAFGFGLGELDVAQIHAERAGEVQIVENAYVVALNGADFWDFTVWPTFVGFTNFSDFPVDVTITTDGADPSSGVIDRVTIDFSDALQAGGVAADTPPAFEATYWLGDVAFETPPDDLVFNIGLAQVCFAPVPGEEFLDSVGCDTPHLLQDFATISSELAVTLGDEELVASCERMLDALDPNYLGLNLVTFVSPAFDEEQGIVSCAAEFSALTTGSLIDGTIVQDAG